MTLAEAQSGTAVTLGAEPMEERKFRTTLAFALGALVVQFLLGMAVNLFVKIATDHPGANLPEYFGAS